MSVTTRMTADDNVATALSLFWLWVGASVITLLHVYARR